jgi:hypothetical protein
VSLPCSDFLLFIWYFEILFLSLCIEIKNKQIMKRFSKNDRYVIAMIAADAEKNGMTPQEALQYAINHVSSTKRVPLKNRF